MLNKIGFIKFILVALFCFMGFFTIIGSGGSSGGGSDPVQNTEEEEQTNQVNQEQELPLTGIFGKTVPISGLYFETATQKGVTGPGGSYLYKNNETITFYLGDILIDSTVALPALGIEDLVSADGDNKNIAENIYRLLLTLDDDGIFENGINITEVVSLEISGRPIRFYLSIDEFEFDSETQALIATLYANNQIEKDILCAYEIIYAGTETNETFTIEESDFYIPGYTATFIFNSEENLYNGEIIFTTSNENNLATHPGHIYIETRKKLNIYAQDTEEVTILTCDKDYVPRFITIYYVGYYQTAGTDNPYTYTELVLDEVLTHHGFYPETGKVGDTGKLYSYTVNDDQYGEMETDVTWLLKPSSEENHVDLEEITRTTYKESGNRYTNIMRLTRTINSESYVEGLKEYFRDGKTHFTFKIIGERE